VLLVEDAVVAVVVLGVDPGFANIGLMGIKLRKLSAAATYAKHIGTKKPPKKKRKLRETDDDIRRLEIIGNEFSDALDEVKPDVVAMERVPRLRNPGSNRQCATAWGAMYREARRRGIPVLVYDTDEIKIAVTGKSQASKELMVKSIKKMFPTFKGWPSKTKVEHVADAGGAALCAKSDPSVELLLRERSKR
jgi:crossover junction endodeoxyribonuclease RuvC